MPLKKNRLQRLIILDRGSLIIRIIFLFFLSFHGNFFLLINEYIYIYIIHIRTDVKNETKRNFNKLSVGQAIIIPDYCYNNTTADCYYFLHRFSSFFFYLLKHNPCPSRVCTYICVVYTVSFFLVFRIVWISSSPRIVFVSNK